MKSADKILQEANLLETFEWDKIIKAMRKYAAQFKKKPNKDIKVKWHTETTDFKTHV